MSLRAYRTFQALILAGSGLGLLVLVLDGHVLDYIHPSLGFLMFIAALVMIVLAQFVLRERPSESESAAHESGKRPSWGLWLAALPLLVGLLIPDPHFAAGTDPMPSMSYASVQVVHSSALETNENVHKSRFARGNFWLPVDDLSRLRFQAVEGRPVSADENLQAEAVPEPLRLYRNP